MELGTLVAKPELLAVLPHSRSESAEVLDSFGDSLAHHKYKSQFAIMIAHSTVEAHDNCDIVLVR